MALMSKRLYIGRTPNPPCAQSTDRMLSPGDIVNSPTWFPLSRAADGRVTMVHLTESAYRHASFLDERLLQQEYLQTLCEPTVLAEAAASLAARSDYIFHIGHCGSTLISRLVGAHEGFLSVREPKLLRTLIEDHFSPPHPAAAVSATVHGPSLEVVLRLLSRTWHPTQRACIKVTTLANDGISLILGATESPSALFVCSSAFNYLRNILAGPNSRVESRALAPRRWRRLLRLAPAEDIPLPRSEGEIIMMNWLSEMTALHSASQSKVSRHLRVRILWVNFDRFLAAPASSLQGIFGALGASVAAATIDAIVGSALMRQYSKAPEHAYDASLRQEVMASADHEHSIEIRRGMSWLDTMTNRHGWVSTLRQLSDSS